MNRCIKINKADNVAVATTLLHQGELITVDGESLVVLAEIPLGHKIALRDIAEGENIIKYGYPIGHTINPVPKGAWVNELNIKTNLDGVLKYAYKPDWKETIKSSDKRTFKGYRRKNGEVGVRNEIWVIPTVGCVNGTVNKLAEMMRSEIVPGSGVDAVVAFPHNYGCSQLGDDHENTRKILADMVKHPNAAGVLVVGLGCENNQLRSFVQLLDGHNHDRIKFMETQKIAGDEIEEGIRLLREIYAVASNDKREDIPLSELCVGLKCGGSDGFSGITANPLLGMFSDYIVSQGGTTVLTEVPEMFGAETILMNRSRTSKIFENTVFLINNFKDYFIHNNQPIYENPSPGNKTGGISTLEEKSLGCTQKSGNSVVEDVLTYGSRLKTKGLNLLSAPGNDLVASTALAASGCQIVLFTTGRGTPFGSFVPTMKISTNSAIATGKPKWIDFNAGAILEGKSMNDMLVEFTEYVISVASGEWVNNEKNNFREISIFKTGVTL